MDGWIDKNINHTATEVSKSVLSVLCKSAFVFDETLNPLQNDGCHCCILI